LGDQGGSVVNGNKYSEIECYQRTLELDPACAAAWKNLAVKGGGRVNGSEYSHVDCAMQLTFLIANETYKTFRALADSQRQVISL